MQTTAIARHPIATRTPLLPQQVDAVTKLLPTRVGALFMEMGTGKSRTAIELVRLRQHKISKVVWFCPVSLKPTVQHEIFKHTTATAADVCVFNDKTNSRNLPACWWYVVGVESMSASNRVALTVNRLIDDETLVIVDESQLIKGHKSMRTQRITVMSERARYRLILTGTPISQGIVDLYAQMRFLSPKILGYRSYYSFARNHLEYSEKYKGLIVRSHNSEWIAAKIKPYVYQVTKDECLDLPDKLYETRYVDMTSEQRRLYEQAKEEILTADIEEFTSYTIFRLFTALQQISCGFWRRRYIDINEKVHKSLIEIPHQRVEMLLDTISSIPNDKKVIIWAKYHYDIEQIAAHLSEQYGADSVALFYGGIKQNDRSIEVEKFRTHARFMISTPSCGGVGQTWNEAHYVIFYNNGFKYADRIQAEDRNHRIGQDHKVVYIDIRTDAGIDDRISAALWSKSNAVSDFKKEVDQVKASSKNKLREFVMQL
ncbi:DEAD/DEAH box helicase [Methylobacter sp. Wu8]|uniref:DEAD/DEAH box helicase n=1 Tax=Methylobacter sp. Wu8 TaxID=3118457 RepID=UPI002F2CE9E6